MKNVVKFLSLGPIVVSDHQVDNTEGLNVHQSHEYGEDEYKEVTVVSLSDAISHPWAMVIELLYTVVAYTAVD